MLAGQASDNGGGLAIEPLAKELTALGLTTDDYLIANCTLHNAQLSLAQPYERVFGVGKRTFETQSSSFSMPTLSKKPTEQKLFREYSKQRFRNLDWIIESISTPYCQSPSCPAGGGLASV
ncbi:hypothetical protein MHU86_2796 [Fragilaria crotonensis]|nr:hypothetical protein MHU86_2796 [Fragilaria crotonensis]